MNTDLELSGGAGRPGEHALRGSRLIRVPMCPVCPLFVRPDSPGDPGATCEYRYCTVKSSLYIINT